MCIGWLKNKVWVSPCCEIRGSSLVDIYKTFTRIVKSVLSRSLYVLFSFIATWRVTVALSDAIYWLLLLTLCPLALETLYSIFIRRGIEMKWMTPSVLFYLVAGIPSIWLLEIKLLNDRLVPTSSNSSESTNSTSDGFSALGITINLDDSGWTLALEQILIFVLVLGKWIAPKGEVSRNELSQLLLVYIAAGADIIELLEVFNESKVSQNAELVYLVMAIWSWSLLQFCLVLTASKDMPNIDEHDEKVSYSDVALATDQERDNGAYDPDDNKPPRGKTLSENHLQPPNPKFNKSTANPANQTDEITGAEVTKPRGESIDIEMGDESHPVRDEAETSKALDRLRAEETIEALKDGRLCFNCFCCYTEVWGMIMSILFQDGPFLILRLVIFLQYNVVTHMLVFFACKNVLVIILLLNRIRVIILEERKPWKVTMDTYKQQKFEQDNARREELHLPLKKRKGKASKGLRKRKTDDERPSTAEGTPRLKKPRWVIWRA